MKYLITIASIVLCTVAATAQTENTAIRKGNQLYKKGKISDAASEYSKAVQQNPNNPVAQFNLGNAQFRKNEFADAEKDFDASVAGNTSNTALQQKALYNKGVTLSKQKKLAESIDAYKKALRIDPADEDTRVNLQKALDELRKQTQKQPQDQPQQQQKDNKQKSEPKTNKKRLEQQLKSLQQKEQEIQEKMQKNRGKAGSQPEKDW